MWIVPSSTHSASSPDQGSTTPALNSPSTLLDTGLAPWVTSSGTQRPRPHSWPGWARRPWGALLFGAIASAVWTPSLCGDSLTCSSPALHASPTAARASGSARRTTGATATATAPSSTSRGSSTSVAPPVGWLENVPEWFTGGHFREFGEELSRMGYDIQEPIFATSAGLGNVHERERVFVMVHAQRLRAGAGEQGEQGRPRCWWDRPANAGSIVADADGGRLEADGLKRGRKGPRVRRDAERSLEEVALASCGGLGELREPPRSNGQPDGCDPRLGSPSRAGREGRERAGASLKGQAARGSVGESGGAFVRPLCPPGRDDYAAWARLAAQGLDTTCFPAIESGVSVVADEMAPSASDLLRIGGNGVDPLVVADAFLRAFARLRGARP